MAESRRTPEWLNVSLTIDAAMVERAARVLRDECAEAGTPCTDLTDLAREMLMAALEAQ